jgi:hypothetical protein
MPHHPIASKKRETPSLMQIDEGTPVSRCQSQLCICPFLNKKKERKEKMRSLSVFGKIHGRNTSSRAQKYWSADGGEKRSRIGKR